MLNYIPKSERPDRQQKGTNGKQLCESKSEVKRQKIIFVLRDGIGAEHSRQRGALLRLRPALLPRQPRHGAPGERLLRGRPGGRGITKLQMKIEIVSYH